MTPQARRSGIRRSLYAPRTLRGRLVAAMVLIFGLSLAASAALDRLRPAGPEIAGADSHSRRLLERLGDEPYQDASVLGLFSLAAALLIWLTSSWSLRPLARASREAQSAGPGDPAARLSRAGLPAEIVPLVDAVNGALDRMVLGFEAERRFTENAAHELRTPLAVLGLRLQRARQPETGSPDWTGIDGDLARMNRLVGQLLDLARKEQSGRSGAASVLPVVNLSRIAREAAAMILPLAEAQGRPVDVDLPGVLRVRGAAHDLGDAVGNLLENAVIFGRGRIGLTGWLNEASAEVSLVVSDEGAGVPAGQEEAVFERFHKAEQSDGTGLGLAIVREVVRGHRGRVGFVPGQGCRVEIVIPAA